MTAGKHLGEGALRIQITQSNLEERRPHKVHDTVEFAELIKSCRYLVVTPCIMSFFFFLHLLQLHSGGNANAVQHALQLQETGHSNDLCGVGSVFRHIMSPVVWPK